MNPAKKRMGINGFHCKLERKDWRKEKIHPSVACIFDEKEHPTIPVETLEMVHYAIHSTVKLI